MSMAPHLTENQIQDAEESTSDDGGSTSSSVLPDSNSSGANSAASEVKKRPRSQDSDDGPPVKRMLYNDAMAQMGNASKAEQSKAWDLSKLRFDELRYIASLAKPASIQTNKATHTAIEARVKKPVHCDIDLGKVSLVKSKDFDYPSFWQENLEYIELCSDALNFAVCCRLVYGEAPLQQS